MTTEDDAAYARGLGQRDWREEGVSATLGAQRERPLDHNPAIAVEPPRWLVDEIIAAVVNVSKLPVWMQSGALGRSMRPLAETVADHLADKVQARSSAPDDLVEVVAQELLETDALTPNDGETLHPDWYVVQAQNVDYLVKTVLDLASSHTVSTDTD